MRQRLEPFSFDYKRIKESQVLKESVEAELPILNVPFYVVSLIHTSSVPRYLSVLDGT